MNDPSYPGHVLAIALGLSTAILCARGLASDWKGNEPVVRWWFGLFLSVLTITTNLIGL